MPKYKSTQYMHICTSCGYERFTTKKENPSGLCNACAHVAKGRKWPPVIPPGAIFADATLLRFWSKVDKETPCACHSYEERCWPWTGRIQKSTGYGVLWVRELLGYSYPIHTHRFAYQAEHGRLPTGMRVLHRPPCLLRHCVRHLYAGTAQQNTDDIKAMNRFPTGERHYRTTLTDGIVKNIRSDYLAGIRIVSLVAKYNLHKGTIRAIVLRKTWRHID